MHRKMTNGGKISFDEFIGLFKLNQHQQDCFSATNQDITGAGKLFGGQILAQAVIAASSTAGNRPIHSLHAYFLRTGVIDVPVDYSVERIRDGNSFSTRRVDAVQSDRPIFTMSASFHQPEAGLEHQIAMPEVPTPEEILRKEALDKNREPALTCTHQEAIDYFGPFEFCRVQSYNPDRPKKQVPEQQIWFRLKGELAADPLIRQALLAFSSDAQLLRTLALPHGISWAKGDLILASLDHSMWFHNEFNLNDWILYACESPQGGAGRGIARGLIFDRNGKLLASTAQEGLLRTRRDVKN